MPFNYRLRIKHRTDRQTDRQTDGRRTDGQTDRQTDDGHQSIMPHPMERRMDGVNNTDKVTNEKVLQKVNVYSQIRYIIVGNGNTNWNGDSGALLRYSNMDCKLWSGTCID